MENKVFINHRYVQDTFDEYLSNTAYSSSDLKSVIACPALFRWNQDQKKSGNHDDAEEKEHYTIGSALHEAVLEPHLFKQHYMVIPKVDRRTSDGKKAYAEFQWEAKMGGKMLLNEEQMVLITNMAESARKNPSFITLMQDSYRELSIYAEDESTGLKVRIRPDVFPQKKSTIVDLKTCVSASPKKFKNDAYNHKYGQSAAFYMDVSGRENYIFAAFEKSPPYSLALYQLNDEMVDYGRADYRMALDAIKWCEDNNHWPNYVQWEIWKECYALNDLENYIETIEKSTQIHLL